MNDSTVDRAEGKLTVGVDLGDRSSHCCVLDAEGTVMEEATVPTNQRAFRRWFSAKEPARVILEAGTHSHWVSRLVGDLGHEVIVANPRMLRFIYGNDSKNDSADAAYLARVGRLDPSLLRLNRAPKRGAPGRPGASAQPGSPGPQPGTPHHPRPGDGQGLWGQAPSLLD